MSLEDELYREIILDHYQNPRNNGIVENADYSVDGTNPLCGDQVKVSFKLDGDNLKEIKFTGEGCSISQASASIMTELVKGKSLEDSEKIAQIIKNMFFEGASLDGLKDFGFDEDEIEEVESLSGVKKYANRVKCATVGWNALLQGIKANKIIK